MKRILKSLAPYWKQIILVFLLLLTQAWCDLELPQYTSGIIDTGIINSGVDHIFPEGITEDEFRMAEMFMTDDEKTVWEDSYALTDGIYRLQVTDEDTLDEYDDTFMVPILINYQMSVVSEDSFRSQIAPMVGMDADQISDLTLEQIGQMMGTDLTVTEEDGVQYVDLRPVLMKLNEAGMITDEQLLAMRESAEDTIGTMGSSLLSSMGIAYATKCDEGAGLAITSIQNAYLKKCGIRMLGIAILMAACAVCVGFLASRIGAGIGRTLREQVYRKVVSFTNGEMDRFSTASLITRNTNDVQQIQMVSVMLLRMVLYAPILGVGGILKVVNTGAGLGWIIVMVVLMLVGMMAVLIVVAMPKFKLMQVLVDRVNLVSREILTGLSVIRAFGRENGEKQRFDRANMDLMSTQLFTSRVMSIMMPGMTLIMNGMSIAIIWFSAKQIDTGAMQVGEMTAFLTYSMQIVMSFLMLTGLSIMLPRAAVAANRIDEVLKTETSVNDPEQPKTIAEKKGVIEFDHVAFRYPGADEDALSDIDFVAEPGKTTAIIGSTGCGKSTLVNLIPRLYDVREGSIRLDGVDVRELTMSDLRRSIGFVPQKGVLFSGTIASNLRFGRPEATDEEIARAARIAQAEDFILEKPDKYESSIAEGGSNVSGGQKQRLSIARAIATNPKVFVFDDSFSALDMKTDAALRRALADEVKNTTVIIVAQRISTILHADQILVLENGRIVGKGTHEELLVNCPVYLDIAKSQLSEKELGIAGKTDGEEARS